MIDPKQEIVRLLSESRELAEQAQNAPYKKHRKLSNKAWEAKQKALKIYQSIYS